jgi:hypothetical protein
MAFKSALLDQNVEMIIASCVNSLEGLYIFNEEYLEEFLK